MFNRYTFRFLSTLFFVLYFALCSWAQRGKDGAKTISSNTKVNEYTILTADAGIGDTILQVQSSSLNANNRFSSSLSAGDLLMVIQMQGASLGGSIFVGLNNTTFGIPKDSTWGRITAYNNCGNYQFVQVKSVLSNTQIILDCGLIHNFTAAGKVQVVRIPRYASLNIPSSTSITCDAWNGSKGGVLSFEVDGNTTLNGTISADTTGFRGGEKENLSEFGLNETACDTPSVGAMKGEGIGGYKNMYNYLGGRYCKGAAANAGGGGDCHNAGGGGGANGGDTALYKAVGVPDISLPNYITAFNLETPSIANVTSSGGGRGGYSASSNNVSPLTNAPAASAWGGDYRIKNGGFGGRPLDYSTGKLFLGGGGGAGDMDDNYGGSGGNGGGLVYAICYGNITGNGSINSNGENGQSTTATSAPLSGNRGQDGAGGGGAGGTIIIDCAGSSSNISCNAKGGAGGTQTIYAGVFNNKNQAQGPGGGGGGGYIKVTNANIISNVNGGVNGTTNSTAMTNFPSNGATKGAAGTTSINNSFVNITTQNDTICSGNTATLSASITNQNNATFEWYDTPIGGTMVGTGSSFITPVLTNNTDYYVRVCPLPYRKKASVILQNSISNNVNAGSDQQLCNASNAALHGSYSLVGSIGTWTSIGNTISISNATDSNATISNLPIGDFTFVFTVTNGCAVNADTVTIHNSTPNTQPNAGSSQNICGTSTTLNATPLLNATWSTASIGVSIANSNNANTAVSNLSAGDHLFIYTVNSSNACPALSDTVKIHVDANPSSANAGNNQIICSSTATLSTSTPAVGNLTWSSLGNSANIQNPTSNTTNVSNLTLGTSQFILTITNGTCPSTSDTVSIQVNQIVTANAGTNQTVCADTSNLLAVSTSPMGVWSSLGMANISGNANQAHVSNLQAGNNLFVWSVTVSGCAASTDTVVVVRNENPSIAQAGTDQTVCSNTATLNATTPLIGNLQWTSLNAATLLTPTASTCVVSNLQAGANIFVLSISNGICAPSVDTVKIQLQNSSIANAGLDKTTCADTITLHALNASNGGTWTSLGTATLATPNASNTLASNLQNGINYFVFTVVNPNCPVSRDTVRIIKSNAPDVANAGADKISCDSTVVLQATTPNAGVGHWSKVETNNSFIVHPDQPITSVESLQIGTYHFCWTVTNSGCNVSKRDTVTVSIYAADTNMKVMNDTTVSPGVAVTLHANGAATYLWNPSSDLSCNNCAEPIFSGNTDAIYLVTLTDAHGCSENDTLYITTTLLKYVEIADIFSPNAADEKNRTFKIHYSGLKEIDLALFDEFGQQVFSISNSESPDKQWDGNINGKPAKSGSYVYTYNAYYLDRTTEVRSGKILLSR
jgi:gliding motility-associated-like protein